MIKPLLTIFLIFTALLQIPHTVADTLIFSVSNVKPWGYYRNHNHPTGLLVEFGDQLQRQILKNAAARLDFENHIRPYPRVISDIKTGRADFAVLFNSPESLNYGNSLGKIASFEILITGRKTSPPINTIDDLAGKTIGYVRGSKYGPAFDSNNKLIKVSLDSMDKGVEMLLKGRLDALICLDQTLHYSLKEKSINPSATKTLLVLGSARADLFISKRSDKAVYQKEVSDALRQLHKKGTIKAIFDLNRPR